MEHLVMFVQEAWANRPTVVDMHPRVETAVLIVLVWLQQTLFFSPVVHHDHVLA
jgi:hypothetical protein